MPKKEFVPSPCHPNREHYCKGMCRPCYNHAYHQQYPKTQAECHPQRRKYAGTLCRQCWIALKPPAICHPNRPSYAGELCRNCSDSKKLYGLSYYEIAADNHTCRICGKPPAENRRHNIDHDHTTKAIRGILCNRCNNALGFFNDSVVLLQRAIDYLNSKHRISNWIRNKNHGEQCRVGLFKPY